jgi:hypothetical protein
LHITLIGFELYIHQRETNQPSRTKAQQRTEKKIKE